MSEELLKKLIGMNIDDGHDLILKADMQMKLEGMRGKKFPPNDVGSRTDRVLVTTDWNHTIEAARMG